MEVRFRETTTTSTLLERVGFRETFRSVRYEYCVDVEMIACLRPNDAALLWKEHEVSALRANACKNRAGHTTANRSSEGEVVQTSTEGLKHKVRRTRGDNSSVSTVPNPRSEPLKIKTRFPSI